LEVAFKTNGLQAAYCVKPPHLARWVYKGCKPDYLLYPQSVAEPLRAGAGDLCDLYAAADTC